MIPFLGATRGREPIISFSTVPAWMFKTQHPVPYPKDPDQTDFSYGYQGSELIDPTSRQLAEYQARLVGWYARGGFTDENGRDHRSGYHYNVPWWGVLNEPEAEHFTTPKQYTQRYDAIVSAVRTVSPKTKFMSLSLCCWDEGPRFFEYFLDPKNHLPGIPIDMISYHFYAHLSEGHSVADWQQSLFNQADGFIINVRYIDAIRKRLAPSTKVNIDELGLRLTAADDTSPKAIPKIYWHLGAAYDSYLYLELAGQGIDVITASHFISSQEFTPTEVMVDGINGHPNARYRALKLLTDSFRPGDQFVATSIIGPQSKVILDALSIAKLPDLNVFQPKEMAIQGIATKNGKRILMVNKTMMAIEVDFKEAGRILRVDIVDEESGDGSPRREAIKGNRLTLQPFAVAVAAVE